MNALSAKPSEESLSPSGTSRVRGSNMGPFLRIAIALTLLFAINVSVANAGSERVRIRNVSSGFVWVTMNCKHSGGGYVACEHFDLRSGLERTVLVPNIAAIFIKMYPSINQEHVICQASAFPQGSHELSWEIHGPPCTLVRV